MFCYSWISCLASCTSDEAVLYYIQNINSFFSFSFFYLFADIYVINQFTSLYFLNTYSVSRTASGNTKGVRNMAHVLTELASCLGARIKNYHQYY